MGAVDCKRRSGWQGGNLFYAIGVAPENDFPNYRPVFDRIIGSLQLASQRQKWKANPERT
jgi:hypothetical protein